MFLFFFFFKQKTAYEMRISDWSSDVCSSDLTERWSTDSRMPCWRCNLMERRHEGLGPRFATHAATRNRSRLGMAPQALRGDAATKRRNREIGRASCRERVCQYV